MRAFKCGIGAFILALLFLTPAIHLIWTWKWLGVLIVYGATIGIIGVIAFAVWLLNSD